MNLSDRKQRILEAIVDSYVKTGEPVSSREICRMLETTLSSATIRNEMAELTSLGLLEQPHTSAGRVPSHLGYRLYINNLMHKQPLPNQDREMIDDALRSSLNDPDDLIEGALEVLADLSKCAVISVLPVNKSMHVRSIQIVKISDHTGVIIIVTSGGNMRSKMFYSEIILTDNIISICSEILGKSFVGVEVEKLTRERIRLFANSLGDMLIVMLPMLISLYEAISEIMSVSVKREGKLNLLFFSEFQNRDLAERVINFLDNDEDMVELLLKEQPNDTQVLIGHESNVEELEDLSVIISKCALSADDFGAISIIGPIRMDYGKMISSLEYLSSMIEQLFKDIGDM